jgi:hypothetical protein
MPRNPDRCPTHPGALLREDVIPATGDRAHRSAICRYLPPDVSFGPGADVGRR